jgi:hypothetical protein
MRKTHVVLGLALAGVLAVACSSSSGPTTFTIAGSCGPLPVTPSNPLTLTGPCTLGAAGDFTLDAGLAIQIGQACGPTAVGITADWIQGTSAIHSSFTGGANLPCLPDAGTDITQPIPISGTFTYAGGTGGFSDATGTALADGGVTANVAQGTLTAQFSLTGSLTY